MEQLHRKMRAVRRRLMWLRFISITLSCLFWLSTVAVVFLLVARLVVPISDESQWQLYTWYAIGGLLALAIPSGLIGVLIGRMTLFHAAVVADEHLHLKERLSSAILLNGERRPMEELLEADAVVAAGRIKPKRDFPLRLPRVASYIPATLVLIALIGLLLNQRNLLASTQTQLTEEEMAELEIIEQENQEDAEELEQLADSIEEAMAEVSNPEAWDELRDELDRISEQLREPDASRLEQLADLSSLTDEVTERRREMEERFNESRNFQADPGSQMTAEMQQALEQGDFNEAMEQMQEMMEQVNSGEMSAEDMEQLANEIEQMAAQFGESSQTGEAMRQAAEAVRAMSSGGQMSQEQMEQAAEAMSQALSDMQDASEQLALAEALEADLNARRASLARNPNNPQERCSNCGRQLQNGQCSGCNGSGKVQSLLLTQGQWRPGETNRRGNGSGGPGQGRGGNPPETPDPNVTFRDELLQSQHNPGVIIAEFRHDDGVQIEGESHVQLADVFMSYDQEAERTLDTEVIPAGYRNITREYFDSIRPGGARPASTDESTTPEGD